MMRKIICISGIVLTIICLSNLSSCEKYILPELTLLQDTLRAPAAGEEFRVGIVCNTRWNVGNISAVDWITCDTSENTVLTVRVAPNATTEQRKHTVSVKTETIEKKLVVIQDAMK